MSTKGGLIFLITSIIVVLCCIVGLIGVYYFDWLKPANSGYTLYTATPDNDARFVIKEDTGSSAQSAYFAADAVLGSTTVPQPQTNAPTQSNTPAVASVQNETAPSDIGNAAHATQPSNPSTQSDDTLSAEHAAADKQPTAYQQTAEVKTAESKPTPPAAVKAESLPTTAQNVAASAQTLSQPKPTSPTRTASGNPVKPSTSNNVSKFPQPKFTKSEPVGKDGSPIKIGFTFDKNRDFHSYGQYVSADEYKYRLAVINNLKIKTIVIDAVSHGNGISQEYYKVAYNANMIPAKILDEVVTSKEFRSLIPKQYLDIEEKMAAFPKGGKVTFSNTDMKELLILWSQGKLTPTQKAWQVKAAM